MLYFLISIIPFAFCTAEVKVGITETDLHVFCHTIKKTINNKTNLGKHFYKVIFGWIWQRISVPKPVSKHFVYPPPLYLFLFNTLIDLSCGLLVRPEKTDDARFFRLQDVPILVSNHKVQLQDPEAETMKRGSNIKGGCKGEEEKGLKEIAREGQRFTRAFLQSVWREFGSKISMLSVQTYLLP